MYRESHLAATLPQSRWRSRQGFADAFGYHWNHHDLLSMLATLVSAAYEPKRHPYCEYPRAAMTLVLQAYDWKWQAVSHRRCSQTAHPPNPDLGQIQVRQTLISSSFWILWSTAIITTQLVRSSESLLRCSQSPRPSARWCDAAVDTTVLELDVLEVPRTYPAQTSACAALSARLMRTLKLTCCWPVTVMMMNERIRWWWP